MQDLNSVVTTDAQAKGLDAGRLIGGLLLLLPGLILYFVVQLVPLVNTFSASYTDIDFPGRPAEFVGMANFERLAQDRELVQAAVYTAAMVTVRMVVVATIPLVIGLLVGGQGFRGRSFNRILMTIVGVLASPVALSLLYVAFLAPVWGRQASPLQFDRPPLSSPDSAPRTLIQLDMLITAGIALAVGSAAFIAVTRGRQVSYSAGRAGIGVWLLGILLAAASFPQTFDLAYIVTRGGPINSTQTLTLKLYQDGFQRLRMGLASAEIVLVIPFLIFIAILIWLVITFFRLRLTFTPSPKPAEGAGLYGLLSVPLVVIIGLPIVGLVVWGLWLAASNNGFNQLSTALNVPNALANTMRGQWPTIWFVQLPITYLLGLSLGFVRPLGRMGSDILFLIFLILAIIPPEFLGMQWFLSLGSVGGLNASLTVAMGFLVNITSLLIFKLFFDGAYERYHSIKGAGQPGSDAFMNAVLLPSLPIFLLVGALLTFASTHALWWPLIGVNSPDLLTFAPQLLMASGRFSADYGTVTAAAVTFLGAFGLLFFAVFALLQILVVDRLAILAGPTIDPTLEIAKPKPTMDDVISGF